MDNPRPLTESRLKRRELWLSLWLMRILSCITQFETLPRAWRDWADRGLDLLARYLLSIIVIRAAQRIQAKRPRAFDPRQKNLSGSLRAMLGGRLRRACKAKDTFARLQKIRRVLENIEAHIEALARRGQRGLTRRFYVFTRVPIGGDVAIPRAPFVAMPSGADTS